MNPTQQMRGEIMRKMTTKTAVLIALGITLSPHSFAQDMTSDASSNAKEPRAQNNPVANMYGNKIAPSVMNPSLKTPEERGADVYDRTFNERRERERRQMADSAALREEQAEARRMRNAEAARVKAAQPNNSTNKTNGTGTTTRILQ